MLCLLSLFSRSLFLSFMKFIDFSSRLGLGVLASASVLLPIAIAPQPSAAQQIVNATPAGQEVPNNSSITWKFDNARLVNPNSLKVSLDGRDVTAQSFIDTNTNTFGYRPQQPLAPGSHTVQVEFTNTQGVSYRAAWLFNVVDVALTIASVTHNASTAPLVGGDTFMAELKGTPGATVSVLLVQNGQTVRTLSATETASGVYRVTFPVGSSDRVSEGIVVSRFEKSGKVVYSVASQAFALNPTPTAATVQQTQTSNVSQNPIDTTPAAAPLNVAITSHTNNAQVNATNGFRLTGTATPGSTVNVTVTSTAPSALGGLIRLGSGTKLLDAVPATVQADGTFGVTVPRPPVVQGGMRYSVTVQANQGTETKTVDLTLIQQ
jgi:methionine-rich copper-binding protein CopC